MDELGLTTLMPRRSYLYAPEPIGVGTGMVESLASYLARLADYHFVSRPDLMTSLVADTINATPTKMYLLYNLMRLRSRELNGMQQIAYTWSSLVSTHTRCTNIDELTLLPWRHLVTARQTIHPSQRWCPSCLETWRSAEQSVYWPLLWSVRAVTACPLHRCPLEQQCPRCHAAVPSLTVREPLGYCWKCKAWLGSQENTDHLQEAIDISQAAVQTAQGVWSLLAASALYPETGTLEKLALILEHIRETTACHPPALAACLGLKRHMLYRLLAPEDRISVPTLLNVLTHLGLTVNDFVLLPAAEIVASGSLNRFIASLPSKHRAIRSRLQSGHRVTSDLLNEAKVVLETALREDDPPTLTTLARNLGLPTVRVLRRHFPHLCQVILEKRRSHRNLETLRAQLAEILDAEDIPASVTTIAAELKTSPVTLKKYFPDEIALVLARRHIIRDEAALRYRVAAFLTVDPPVSLAEVSRRLGIKLHHIRQHCPDLRQAIVQRFAVYQHACALERTGRRVTAVREAVVKLNAQGQFPSKTKVAAMLGITQWRRLNKYECEAFSATMHELGLLPR